MPLSINKGKKNKVIRNIWYDKDPISKNIDNHKLMFPLILEIFCPTPKRDIDQVQLINLDLINARDKIDKSDFRKLGMLIKMNYAYTIKYF